MSQSSEHLKLEPEFTALRRPPQPQSSVQSQLWDVVEWDIHGCGRSTSQRGPKPLRNVSSSLLNLSHEDLKQLGQKKEVQPGVPEYTSQIFLSWPGEQVILCEGRVSVGVGRAVISERSHLVNSPQAVL